MISRNGNLHPTLAALALYARRDLPPLERLKMQWHVRKCVACRAEVSVFADRSEKFRAAGRTEGVPGLEVRWMGLEREMLGNIAVGVAAARCIENVGNRRVLFRAGWLVAALMVLFVLGWFAHIPPEQNARLYHAVRSAFERPAPYRGAELDANTEGISVRNEGTTLRFMHPSSAIVALAGSSAVTGRYVDEDTGQITITKVYAQ